MWKSFDEQDLIGKSIDSHSYRSEGVMTWLTRAPVNLAGEQLFRRVLAYVDIENKASLRAFLRVGFYYCGEEKERRRFFKIWRSWQSGK